MTPRIIPAVRWRLLATVAIKVEEGAGGTRCVIGPPGRKRCHHVPAAMGGALAGLAARLREGASDAALADAGGTDPGVRTLVHYFLAQLKVPGLLEAVVLDAADGEALAVIRPDAGRGGLDLPPALPPAASGARLTNHALLCRQDGAVVALCSELGLSVGLVHADIAAALLGDRPVDVLPAGLAAILAHVGVLVDPAMPPHPSEAAWTAAGRTFLVQSLAPPRIAPARDSVPAVRPPHRGEEIALPAPAPSPSAGIRDVLARRRSRYNIAKDPPSLEEIGSLLHGAVRNRESAAGAALAPVRRPYPSAGSLHEIEFYLALSGGPLPDAVHHYRAEAHILTRLAGSGDIARRMAALAMDAWNAAAPPPCVLVLASRHPRIAWKYGPMAIRLSLLDAGAAIAALDLVRTEMGLAGAAIGNAMTGLLAEATGVSTFEEFAVAAYGFGRLDVETGAT